MKKPKVLKHKQYGFAEDKFTVGTATELRRISEVSRENTLWESYSTSKKHLTRFINRE